ncbi:hypothetical protein PROFUN_04477 [Planoprotostelium fungivorum]|uniref:Uncharacterized protein n=1 Tax=Planoprotostelium fungivorum TaxID=1890364 RepID=A0A2P6NVR3_9EUKA|nr:hypothetical protein PROFUN_04477 [Planoprotostelium fungivorum]
MTREWPITVSRAEELSVSDMKRKMHQIRILAAKVGETTLMKIFSIITRLYSKGKFRKSQGSLTLQKIEGQTSWLSACLDQMGHNSDDLADVGLHQAPLRQDWSSKSNSQRMQSQTFQLNPATISFVSWITLVSPIRTCHLDRLQLWDLTFYPSPGNLDQTKEEFELFLHKRGKHHNHPAKYAKRLSIFAKNRLRSMKHYLKLFMRLLNSWGTRWEEQGYFSMGLGPRASSLLLDAPSRRLPVSDGWGVVLK